jgi:leader peptidase (prepilin peptidase)/N-methyltransferase
MRWAAMTTDLVILLFAGAYGAMVGSFLNVCVYRLPLDRSVITPRSYCPSCAMPIAWYDNIPVFSWLILRAKCRKCGVRISPEYPLIELLVALAWAFMVWRHGPTLEALAAALFVTLMLGILLTDLRHMIIPFEFSIGGLGAGLAFAALPGGVGLKRALIGAALGWGLLWAAGAVGKKLAGRDAMGGGDLWMMALVGAFLGWRGVLMTVFLGSLIGTLVYLPALIRRERHKEVPFGVYLALGGVVSLLAGDALARWYVSLFWVS